MTTRDRIVIIVLSALAVVAAAWLLAVAPEREQAAKIGAQVSAARSQLATAESSVVSARGAQAGMRPRTPRSSASAKPCRPARKCRR